MEDQLTYTSAFLLGLVSSTMHCIGMCGGIIGALSLGLPAEVRAHRPRLLLFITSYNLGRIASYSIAGLIAGAIGAGALASTGFDRGHVVLQYLGVTMMVAIGLYLAGWAPQLAIVEKAGVPVWRRLEPLGRRLLPVTSLPQALGYGLIWGWLPCGLVYFSLLYALTAGDAVRGGFTMLSFGLGTLPVLLATGYMTTWLSRFARSKRTRQVVGLLIILLAIGSLFIPMDHSHGGHTHVHH